MNHPCPNCGYCPTCGRKNVGPATPYWPYGTWPYRWPWTTMPITTWTSGGSQSGVTGTTTFSTSFQ